ncbi:hypothetical protein [Paracidovorax citrulli]|uniref:hypothetical protein n=1 Tax=Paracidovorax citrulli TaxID=80869 RepID=UPI0015FEFF33|nr:hypothetical protein [Paracidovorax citrulli]
MLTKAGTSSADAIKKITENFDLGKVQGIRDFSSTLDKLGGRWKDISQRVPRRLGGSS